ncbi:MAG: S8 family serine peptidase [Candidatus Thermoplasmatota archaeon]
MKIKWFVFAITLSLLFSGMLVATGGEAIDEKYNYSETNIVLISLEGGNDVNKIESTRAKILERYGDSALVEIPSKAEEKLNSAGIDIVNTLPARTELSVKGHQFNINQGVPEFSDELTIDEYEDGEEGLYLVHMIGPVHTEWRKELESMGVEILNYQPNYAYEVRMTPEIADKVEGLEFVDWTGTYQPGFKLAEDLEPGLVEVTLTNQIERDTLNQINSRSKFLSITGISEEHTSLTAKVQTKKDLLELAQMNEVYYISNQPENRLHDEVATQIIGGGAWRWDSDDNASTPYRGISDHGALVNQLGWTGNDEVVAVADTGINPDHQDFQNRVVGGHYWESGSWEDNHGHGTHVAGSVAGDTYNGTNTTVDDFSGIDNPGPYYAAQGPAYDSELFSVKIFDSGGNWIGPNDYFDIVAAANNNSDAYIHSNSWGSTENLGEYLSSSEAYDEAVRDANRSSNENEPMVIVVAAGNEGSNYNTVGAPATAKNVIAVGSTENFIPDRGVDNPDRISGFSSRGWTDDNRIKPDVVAPGEEIISTDYDDNGGYNSRSGTSMATPAVSSAASVVVAWYEEQFGEKPSPAMVRGLLINTAYDLDDGNGNTDPIPNKDEGWGMVNLPAMMYAPTNFTVEDQNNSLTTGEVKEYTINYENSSEPLNITLTWTDKEAQSGDTQTLKNDLNLEVISPNGNEYRGNAFQNGWTQPDRDTMVDFDKSGDGWDDVNNVENVYIPSSELETGTYTVRVIGENVPADANNDGKANQDYSLVNWNAVESELGVPTDPDPADGATGVPTDVELSVYVEHEDGDSMDVSFYDASDDSLIGTDNNVANGSRAYQMWEDLDYGTTYQWYAIADDGTQTVTSDTWSFTTEEATNPSITITRPEGGETWAAGDDEEITWDTTAGDGTITGVDLEYTTDDGASWNVIVEGTENDGSYMWTVPDEPTEEARIRGTVHDDLGNSGEDVSGLFTIKGDSRELTIDSTAGGSVVKPGEGTFEYDHGTVVDLEAIADDGYHFVEWTGDNATIEDTTANATTIEMLDDYSITAEFAIDTYDVTFEVYDENNEAYEGATIELTDYEALETDENGEAVLEVEHGADVDYLVDEEGYELVDEVIEDITEDVTETINLEVSTYELTISSTDGGEVVDPGEGTYEYDHGTIVDLEAIADVGYHFVEWTGDNATIADTTANETTITMESDYSVTVDFEINTYTLDISSTAGGSVVEPGEETYEYDHGTVVDLEAIADDGYHFVEWTGDETGTDSTIEITMYEDVEITAVFEEEDEDDDDTPGFTTMLFLVASIIAVAIYRKKKR